MEGFYSIWTKPYMMMHPGEKFKMRDFELLTFILSAMKWQELNGNVTIYADEEACRYLEDTRGISLFKGGVKRLIVDEDIDPACYWAAGKLYAIRAIDRPYAMIDLDLIVWKCLSGECDKNGIKVIHREPLRPEIYPDYRNFAMREGYSYPYEFDDNVLPANTALLMLGNVEFAHEYANTAIEFMRNTISAEDNLCRMVFAEQRLIAIAAEHMNITIDSFYDYAENIGMQDMFTHLWGHKNILKYNYDERLKYCRGIMKMLKEEFPQAFDIVSGLPEMREYILENWK